MNVTREQRHTRQRRCPICDGADGDPRGRGARCSGFTSADGTYAHCSREEFAGGIDANGAGLYAHRLAGSCHCGISHGAASQTFDVIEARYPYTDESGALLFEVIRRTGKQFRQRKPDGAGGWEWKLNGVRRVPYRLRELLAAAPSQVVHICEGEKDVESLERRGYLATTNPGGAGKWSFVASVAAAALQGRDVVVIADRDEVGRKHALEVETSLRGVARSVRVVEPPEPHKDVSDLLVAGGTLEQLVALEVATPPEAPKDPKAPAVRTPGTRVRALGQLGPVRRLATGMATLDRACRGGVPTRRLVVVGGAPGAGKTTLATNWLWRWAKEGVPVAMLAVDEDGDGVLMRIAQLEGIDAERIEERDPASLEALAERVDSTPLLLVDGDEPMGSVEGVASLLAARAEGQDAVLVIDSIQTARALGTEEAGSPRERVDCVMRAVKAVRDRYGFLVVATCELARGSYRSKNSAEQINDLAAFKESGGIEYAAQTALVLRSVADESSLVDVAIAKNRAYRKDPFRLRLDHVTTTLTEVEMPPVPEGGPSRSRVDTLEKDAAEIRKLLVSQPGIAGLRGVRTGLRARKVGIGNERVAGALEYLRVRGEIDNRGDDRRPSLWLRTVEPVRSDDE